MKKYLIALPLIALSANVAWSQDDGKEELNAFGYPDKSLVKVIEAPKISRGTKVNPKPQCDDPKLSYQARKVLKPFITNEQKSIYEKRKFKLILKNVDNFVPVDIEKVSSDKNRKLAGRIIELKINNSLDAENIKVCKTQSPELDATLYLVMYDERDNIRVDIVNFTDRQIPSFVYSKD